MDFRSGSAAAIEGIPFFWIQDGLNVAQKQIAAVSPSSRSEQKILPGNALAD